jgi:uncharacterized membrane protein YcaP (DUF421 family)
LLPGANNPIVHYLFAIYGCSKAMEGSNPIFFKGWYDLGRTALLSLLAYAGFIVLLRFSGKRTLSKMNTFDFVFVVALGSSLANVILSSDVTLFDGMVAITVLIAMQLLISWIAARSNRVERIINGEPALLFFQGRFLHDAMKRHRVTEMEIRAAIRSKGFLPLETVHAVVLETDGSFSVVWRNAEVSESGLGDVPRAPA